MWEAVALETLRQARDYSKLCKQHMKEHSILIKKHQKEKILAQKAHSAKTSVATADSANRKSFKRKGYALLFISTVYCQYYTLSIQFQKGSIVVVTACDSVVALQNAIDFSITNYFYTVITHCIYCSLCSQLYSIPMYVCIYSSCHMLDYILYCIYTCSQCDLTFPSQGRTLLGKIYFYHLNKSFIVNGTSTTCLLCFFRVLFSGAPACLNYLQVLLPETICLRLPA